MANKTQLTVTTEVGTFTRTTARTYSHIVVVSGGHHFCGHEDRADDDFGILGWSGRLDLAQKLASSYVATLYRNVRIYALDGTRIS